MLEEKRAEKENVADKTMITILTLVAFLVRVYSNQGVSII